MAKFYRVWRRNGGSRYDGHYNGFRELEAKTAKEAVTIVCNSDYDDGDTVNYTYEVDRIADLNGDADVLEDCGEF